jgi:hypothetical protein
MTPFLFDYYVKFLNFLILLSIPGWEQWQAMVVMRPWHIGSLQLRFHFGFFQLVGVHLESCFVNFLGDFSAFEGAYTFAGTSWLIDTCIILKSCWVVQSIFVIGSAHFSNYLCFRSKVIHLLNVNFGASDCTLTSDRKLRPR